MQMEKKLGKIVSVYFGLGGYQECQFGLSLTFEGPELSGCKWGCGVFIGNWDVNSIKHDEGCKWTERDRVKWHDDMCRKVSDILNKAKVKEVSQLLGKPVEVEFEGCGSAPLKNWRILEEVL